MGDAKAFRSEREFAAWAGLVSKQTGSGGKEEIFYPVVREAIDDDDLMNEAVVEHTTAKDLIAQIQSMRVSDPMYDAVVKVLGEYINHHVEEEQDEIFPKARKSKLDLEEIGREMAERKEVLLEK